MAQVSLLTKGPKFCPTTKGNYLHTKADSQNFTRKLKLIEKFHDASYVDHSLVKNPSKLNIRTDNDELRSIIWKIRKSEPTHIDAPDNLSQREREALRDLKCANDIVIKKADKGNTLVVLDTVFYRDKLVLSDHLNTDTYSIAPINSDKKVYRELKKLVEKHKNCLTEKEIKYIIKDDWSSSNFYVLPKIHKNKTIIDKFKESNSEFVEMEVPRDLKGRPITAGPTAPTRGLSELLEKILAPFVPHLKTYVKDDRDFLSRLPRFIPYECDLISCDIVSLYTNIPHALGVEAVRYWLTKRTDLIPARFSIEFILEAVQFVLQNNYFMFDGVCRHQDIGTAMGTVMAPPYACLTIGYLEETKLERTILPQYFSIEDCALILRLLLRYIDDGFIPWPRRLNRASFVEAINSLHPSIRFTIEESRTETANGQSTQCLNFLDVMVILHSSGSVETDIYYKDTNSHDYLDYHSHHPTHTKNNIVFGLAKKIVEFVSNYETEEKRLKQLHDYLIACNYPPLIVKKGIHNARLQGPGPDPEKKRQTIPFVTTHNSNMKSDRTVKLSNQLLENATDDRLKSAFQNSKIVMALKQPPNLLRQLSRAAFSTTIIQRKENGIFTCSRSNCELCKSYLQPCSSFITSRNYEWFIRSHITCHSKNVIYFLKCLTCDEKTTYSGKTNNLRNRTNVHISGCRTGRTTDIFDLHVFECNSRHVEPFFKMYVFIELMNDSLLDAYERYVHENGHDTMNKK